MSAHDRFALIGNGDSIRLDAIPSSDFSDFRETLTAAVVDGARISSMPVREVSGGSGLQMIAVLSFPEKSRIGLLSAGLPRTWRSITPECHAAHWFEREIAEQWGITPEGHPWLKPIRFSASSHVTNAPDNQPVVGMADFFEMQGGESHEVAVGPVHAGVIEPGHFRFLCHGETVYHLEISLGYQHRGIERAMAGGPSPRSRHYMETLAGDTSIGHMTAYSQLNESLAGVTVPTRALAIRAVAAELERIANHVGDLGAMAGDVGFLPTMNYCGRIRGDVLNMTAVICGNRFGRGLVEPTGVSWDMDDGMRNELLRRLDAVQRDATGAVELMFDTPSVIARFENIGEIKADTARRIGLVGVAARASGLERDVRFEFPYGLYRLTQLPVCTWRSGDCLGRASVRWAEVIASLEFIRQRLNELPGGPVRLEVPALASDTLAVSLVEGWRGEICHVAATDGAGRFAWYKAVDPSFHNWFGLALALRGQQISDFPLCNKSFNLSYCGHDQ